MVHEQRRNGDKFMLRQFVCHVQAVIVCHVQAVNSHGPHADSEMTEGSCWGRGRMG
jgi:hypothetical protein